MTIDSVDEELRSEGPVTRDQSIAKLIARLDHHEAEGQSIQDHLDFLGLDAKKLKAIRAAQKTLSALMAVDPETAARVSK